MSSFLCGGSELPESNDAQAGAAGSGGREASDANDSYWTAFCFVGKGRGWQDAV